MRKKQITRCVLLAVFAVVSITAVLVSRHEEKVEQIKNSGKTILSIPTDTVTAFSWTNEDGTFSFTKGDTWTYDGDSAFPVDEGKSTICLRSLRTSRRRLPLTMWRITHSTA